MHFQLNWIGIDNNCDYIYSITSLSKHLTSCSRIVASFATTEIFLGICSFEISISLKNETLRYVSGKHDDIQSFVLSQKGCKNISNCKWSAYCIMPRKVPQTLQSARYFKLCQQQWLLLFLLILLSTTWSKDFCNEFENLRSCWCSKMKPQQPLYDLNKVL